MSADLTATAEAAWGKPLPDWVQALALACMRSSQTAVSRQIGRSPAVISNVLRNSYAADTARIEERVRGVFLDGKVLCPAWTELPAQDCQDWRDKARVFVPGNPLRRQMYHACRSCPVFLKTASAAKEGEQ